MVSIIIPYHNEGQDFVEECIDQIKASADMDYEIIIVDDASSRPLRHIEGTKILRNKSNKGVGASFDYGVSQSLGEDIILTACDMRFIPNNWMSKMIAETDKYREALVCSACVGLNREKPENMNFLARRKHLRCFGATILMFHDKKTNPRKEETFRGIIEAKWKAREPQYADNSYEIPCVLGACYAIKRQWYEYIDGFWGHTGWGTLEPYLSLKSWQFGGSCRIVPTAETGHIFKRNGVHNITQDTLLYNKMLVSTLLLDDHERLIDFLGTNSQIIRAKKKFDLNKSNILAKKAEYKNKKVFHEKDFCRQFEIDYRL